MTTVATERLALRPLTLADAPRFFEIFGDPRTNVHNPVGPCTDLRAATSMLAARAGHWARHGFGQWAIALRERPDALIGFGGVAWRDYDGTDRLNLGYRFAADAWGRGYATELGTAALHYAFADLGQPAVHAIVRPTNLASVRVLEKLGMRRDGDLDDVPGQARSLVYVATSPQP